MNKIKLLIDSCVWNKFFEKNYDLEKELPKDQIDLFISTEIWDREIEHLKTLPDKQNLYAYIEDQKNKRDIKRHGFFGFSDAFNPDTYTGAIRSGDAFNPDDTTVGGFFSAWHITPEVSETMRKIATSANGDKKKNGLQKNQADIGLALRAVTGIFTLTADEKNGVLKDAQNETQNVIYWSHFDESKESLLNFILKNAKTQS